VELEVKAQLDAWVVQVLKDHRVLKGLKGM
jgi:hypothetical protein